LVRAVLAVATGLAVAVAAAGSNVIIVISPIT